MSDLRILIVGAGAVGGYFGARLIQAGRDVSFLVRSGRAEQIRRDGLRIHSPHGDAAICPKLVQSQDLHSLYDVVFLSVKAFSLEAAIRDMSPAVGPDTVILPVLNGMGHMDVLDRRFGEGLVIGGVCRVATEVAQDGRIVQVSDIQQLVFGERNGRVSLRIEALDREFKNTGFEVRLSENITQEMWEKWVQLAAVGAITCIISATIGDVVAVSGGSDFVLDVLRECADVARASGHPPSEAFMQQQTKILTEHGSRMTSSMYRDMRKGARVEVDAIIGSLVERGRAFSLDTRLLEAAFVRLHVYQAEISQRTSR